MCLCVLFAGQASSRREPHPLRQELELSDHGRGHVRPLWPLRKHQTDTHRQRSKVKRDRVRRLRRRHGCAYYAGHLLSYRLISDFVTGQKRIGTPERLPFARAVYRGVVPHACEAGRGGGQGGVGTERRGVGAAEEEARYQG
jgi:hypothetical protein